MKLQYLGFIPTIIFLIVMLKDDDMRWFLPKFVLSVILATFVVGCLFWAIYGNLR